VGSRGVVTCNGCFDGLHRGHLFFLGYCAAHGDELIVGINTDRYMREVKGVEPMFAEEDRKRMLLETGVVKEVRVFSEDIPNEFIKRVRPRVHCTGELDGANCPEAAVCAEVGVELVLVPRVGDWSSTQMRGDRL